MRIISGKARGLKLIAPEGLKTRPTTDRMKENLFNIIGFDVPNSNFLDLYSGSGAIGIEALSRGANKAVFVDNNNESYKCILNNLERSKLNENARIYKKNVEEFLNTFSNEDKFDIIFMDPPYYEDLVVGTIQLIINKDVLSENGMIIVEKPTNLPNIDIEEMSIFKIKKYKTTTLLFIERKK